MPQLSLSDLFRGADFREECLRKLPADQRVIRLLLALDHLSVLQPLPTGVEVTRYRDGSVEMIVPYRILEGRMRKVRNTVRSYIDLAACTPWLAVDPQRSGAHHFSILWQQILDDTGVTIAGGRITPREQLHTAVSFAEGDRVSHASRQQTPRAREGPPEPPPRGGNFSPRGGQKGGQKNREGGSKQGVKKGVKNPPETPSLKTPGFCISGSENKNLGFSRVRIDPLTGDRKFPPGWWVWWRQQIAARNLRDPCDVEELYGLAVAAGLVHHSAIDRRKVFAEAARDLRVAKSRGAVFRENVAQGWWFASNADDDRAGQMLQEIDRDLPEPVPVVADDEGDRERQLWALQERFGCAAGGGAH
jgi:hypothetical protein